MKKYVFSKEDILHGDLSKKLIGGKAEGFKLLKDYPEWIPEFFVLSSRFIFDYIESHNNFLEKTSLKKAVFQLLESTSAKSLISTSTKLLIRSSAEHESIENRGEHDSFPCSPSIKDLSELITDIYLTWEKSAYSGQSLSLIIQVQVVMRAIGHLSNERRVSERDRDWLVDYEVRENLVTQENRRFKIFRNRYPDPDEFIISEELFANKFDLIFKQLHHPAELVTLKNKGQRVHFEWVWDGRKVWIVQSDIAVNSQKAIDPNLFLEGEHTKENKLATKFKVLREIKTLDSSCFKKTEHQVLFHEAGMETTDLWVIDASIFFDEDITKTESLTLELDSLLSIGPIVIRTDLDHTKYDLQQRQNLPRSSSLLNLDDTLEFIKKCLSELKITQSKASDICFIVHSYIPSLSSAFCFADPSNPKVRIDSIWGLPDGLQYYAHDSFEVNVKTKQTLKEKKRYKGFMLGANQNGDGQWIPAEINSPYDWRASINKSSRNDIAIQTYNLAKHLKKSVVVMWFINTPDGSIHPQNVPWYMEGKEIDDFSIEKRDSVYSRNLYRIENYNDIVNARIAIQSGSQYNSILLYPEETIIRDNDFLKSVAELSKEFSIGVIFFGSILQHAFYQLRKEGVNVSCIEPFSPQKEIVEYNKLVRDKIPEKITKDGETPQIEECIDEDYIDKLEDKIIEEANEVAGASSIQDRTEEIADLLEVIQAICEKEDISLKEILKAKKEKFLKNGGFKKGLVLISSRSKPTIEVENAFQKQVITKSNKSPIVDNTLRNKNQKNDTDQLEFGFLIDNDKSNH
ncbi:nucleoside triphosphate pyrophosphohydrolase [Pseudomonadota bacterium]|nr:nucleoside triphosphate pyrophosphohydrolase [Pseudomonadota bacterium]